MTTLTSHFGPAALITGASDGIGRVFAHALAEQGFDLILIARRADVLDALAQDLTAKHGVAVQVTLPRGVRLRPLGQIMKGMTAGAKGLGRDCSHEV